MGAQNNFSIVNRLKSLKLTQNISICSFSFSWTHSAAGAWNLNKLKLSLTGKKWKLAFKIAHSLKQSCNRRTCKRSWCYSVLHCSPFSLRAIKGQFCTKVFLAVYKGSTFLFCPRNCGSDFYSEWWRVVTSSCSVSWTMLMMLCCLFAEVGISCFYVFFDAKKNSILSRV